MFSYIFTFALNYLVITALWVTYEFVFIGEVKEDIFHTIIAIALALSLTFNMLD